MNEIEDILKDNAKKKAELDAAEDARLELARLRYGAWYKLCLSLFPDYRAKAMEKVKVYLRDNIVLPHEFVSILDIDNDTREQGYLLILKIEEDEFELTFSYRFEGNCPETMKVFWNGDPKAKEDLDSYPEDW